MKKSIIVLFVLSIVLLSSGLVINASFDRTHVDDNDKEKDKESVTDEGDTLDKNDSENDDVLDNPNSESYECISMYKTKDEDTSELLRTFKRIYKFSVEDNKITKGSIQEFVIFSSIDGYNKFFSSSENIDMFKQDADNLTAILKDEVMTFINEDTNGNTFSQAYLKQLSAMELECRKVSIN